MRTGLSEGVPLLLEQRIDDPADGQVDFLRPHGFGF